MGKGRRFENRTASELMETTTDEVMAYPVGYSGSNPYPCPDLHITTPAGAHGVELKNWSPSKQEGGDWELRYIDRGQLEQLQQVANGFTDVALGIKFERRELLVLQMTAAEWDSVPLDEKFPAVDELPFVDWYTDDNGDRGLRFRKPDTDVWPSKQAGVDTAQKLATELLSDDFIDGRSGEKESVALNERSAGS